MTSCSSSTTAFPPSRPKDREAKDQEDQEGHDKDIEQEAGDVRGGRRYAGEAEYTGDDRHHQEEQCPFQNRHRLLLRGLEYEVEISGLTACGEAGSARTKRPARFTPPRAGASNC